MKRIITMMTALVLSAAIPFAAAAQGIGLPKAPDLGKEASAKASGAQADAKAALEAKKAEAKAAAGAPKAPALPGIK